MSEWKERKRLTAGIQGLSAGNGKTGSDDNTDKVFFSFVADFLQGAPDFLLKFLRNTAELAVDLIVDHFVQCLAEDIRLPDIEGIFPELSAEVADEIPALVFRTHDR